MPRYIHGSYELTPKAHLPGGTAQYGYLKNMDVEVKFKDARCNMPMWLIHGKLYKTKQITSLYKINKKYI